MSRVAVGHLLALVNEAFESERAHSLMGNVAGLQDDDWDWKPPGGERTIREIVEHAAIAKRLYAEHLFGAAKRSYADVERESPLRAAARDTEALLAWAREGHAAFVAGVAALGDDALGQPARTHYGSVRSTASVIGAMVEHDCYHAGEINHLRALRYGDDAWWPGLRGK